MEIRLKENIYIGAGGDYLIPRGSVGVLRKRIVYFYDTTKTHSIGIDRDICMTCKDLFSVSQQMTDRDISQKDLLEVLMECSDMFKSKEDYNRFLEITKSL
jgi:hypothetical protein